MARGRFHGPGRFPGQPDGRWADGNWELSLRPVTAYRSPRLGGRDPILPTQTAATIGLTRTDWAARDVKRLPIPGMLPITLRPRDRKSTRLNSSHVAISYAVFCLKKKN